ncbi:MAG: Tfp pilus assembly protein FimT/FimU [Luteolibacter sp.]|jgi:prepilin-type N-terminal cleavage/methylation domain-containing protein
MMRPPFQPFMRRVRTASAFSLIELLVVIAIVAILLTASVGLFSNSANQARQASRDIIKAHLQQARAHAIATGNATALAIPVLGTSEDLGGKAISLFEVEKTGVFYSPITDNDGRQRMLQRWETLPGGFHFLPASLTTSGAPTIVDSPAMLEASHQGSNINCHVIVFAPNGQIVVPTTAIHIAIARANSRGGTLVPIEKSGGKPVYDLLQVNRLTARTRTIQP